GWIQKKKKKQWRGGGGRRAGRRRRRQPLSLHLTVERQGRCRRICRQFLQHAPQRDRNRVLGAERAGEHQPHHGQRHDLHAPGERRGAVRGPGISHPPAGSGTTYTPPASVGAATGATLTATSGPLTATATSTVNSPAI